MDNLLMMKSGFPLAWFFLSLTSNIRQNHVIHPADVMLLLESGETGFLCDCKHKYKKLQGCTNTPIRPRMYPLTHDMSSVELCKDEQAREWEDQLQEREQTLDEPLTCCRWGKMAVGRGLIYPFIKRLLNWWATGNESHPQFGGLAVLAVKQYNEELEE